MNAAQQEILRFPRAGDLVRPIPGKWTHIAKRDEAFSVIAANPDARKIDIQVSEVYAMRCIAASDFRIVQEGPEPRPEPEKEQRRKPDPAHPPVKAPPPPPAKYDPYADNFWE